MIEDVEDDIYELPNSYFSKSTAIVFDKINNGKAGVLPESRFVDLIETLGYGFRSKDLAVHLIKLDPNESVSLDRFAFVRWYVGEEVSLDSVEEAERFLGCGF